MKRNFVKIAIVVAIVAVSGINVFNAQKPEVLSDVAMENVEALADNEGSELEPGPYDIKEECTNHCYNGELYKQSKVVRCYPGGNYACKEGDFYRYKMDNGQWSSWIPA